MGFDVDTLIIGAGFSGLSVASRLPVESRLVIDQGTPFDFAGLRQGFKLEGFGEGPNTLSMIVDGELKAVNKVDRSTIQLPLTGMSVNIYSALLGGISNLWGGYAARVTRETFEADGVVAWPITYDEMVHYYVQAERLMAVHGDPEWPGYSVAGATPGWREWKARLSPWFPQAHMTPEAKNVTGLAGSNISKCLGNGHCALCPNDAKARPQTTFPMVDVVPNSKVRDIVFDGSVAKIVNLETQDGPFSMSVRQVVLAAGGLENVALLNRSDLPAGARRELIGQYYQDHTAAEIMIEMPFDIPRLSVGTESHVELPELSGYFNGIEIKTLFLTGYPSNLLASEALYRAGVDAGSPLVARKIRRLGTLYLQIEIPPEWNMALVTRGADAFIDSRGYLINTGVMDKAVAIVADRVRDLGLPVLTVAPHYRRAFGGHHYSGTTTMSRTPDRVVDENHRLVGTANCFVNGASVMPRCGGSGPTLSLVAMGLRLGDYLSGT